MSDAGAGQLVDGSGDISGKARQFFGRANIFEVQPEKFFPRIAVMAGCGFINFEQGAGLQIGNPHRHRAAIENDTVLTFAGANFGFGVAQLLAFAGFLDGAANGGDQSFEAVLEHVIRGARL